MSNDFERRWKSCAARSNSSIAVRSISRVIDVQSMKKSPCPAHQSENCSLERFSSLLGKRKHIEWLGKVKSMTRTGKGLTRPPTDTSFGEPKWTNFATVTSERRFNYGKVWINEFFHCGKRFIRCMIEWIVIDVSMSLGIVPVRCIEVRWANQLIKRVVVTARSQTILNSTKELAVMKLKALGRFVTGVHWWHCFDLLSSIYHRPSSLEDHTR